MFIDNKVSNDIKECMSIPQLVRYLSVNRNMLLAFQSDIYATIDNINKNYDGAVTDIDKSYFDFFYHDKKEVTKLDYDFLTLYSNNILKYMIDIRTNMCCGPLFLLLLDKNNIFLYEDKLKNLPDNKYEIILKNFYQKILDLYVPCDEPEEAIKRILSIGTLSDIIRDRYDTTKFFISDNLFKTIVNIYTDDNFKFETFKKLHYMETKSIRLNDKIDLLEKRYERYLKDDTRDLIYELLIIFNDDNMENKLLISLNNIRKEYPDIHIKVIESFLKDIIEISILNQYQYDMSVSVVNKLCDKGIYNILDSRDIFAIESLLYKEEYEPANEAYSKNSSRYHNVQNKVYNAYKNYKSAEGKVDSQITKAVQGMKNILIGDVKTEIIEGKKFSAISLLKKLLGTAAIFSFGPIKGVITLVVRYALKKSTTITERKKIILELEAELEMIEEKINDARGDNNRQAKYAMMRTKTELTNALKRLKYGLEADERSVNKAKSTISNIRSKL